MVSFAHPEQIEVAAEICHSVVLDNGAFSAWKAKKDYDFSGYLAWAQKWLKHPAVEWCVIPDVIDGTEADNDARLEAWPLDKSLSVPVYHLHESLDRAFDLAMGYPRIALGSSGKWATVGNKEWWARMRDVMAAVCDSEGHPLCKLHGLRMLNPGVFSKLPLASADSTNVARNVGIDKAWTGSYQPSSKSARALILMDRIERHASARAWTEEASSEYHNDSLLG